MFLKTSKRRSWKAPVHQNPNPRQKTFFLFGLIGMDILLHYYTLFYVSRGFGGRKEEIEEK